MTLRPPAGPPFRVLVIDNYDSFTYNLVQYLGELGARVEVVRNDQATVEDLEARSPSHLLISPGPGGPLDTGISLAALERFHGRIPILGVCLGHQAIAHAFGGRVVRAPVPVHGKTSPIYHTGRGILAGLPNPFRATRYHSLVVAEPLPEALRVTALTADGLVMALEHRQAPTFGVQFHPESILTEGGKRILENFLHSAVPSSLGAGVRSER